jgi:hypothetical protein
MNRLDHSSFHRLDDLGAVVGDDLANRGGHDIDTAKDRPQQRDQGESHDQPQRNPWRRMSRGVA